MLTIGLSVMLFLVGAVLCFFGARFYRVWFGIVGLLVGVFAGYQIGFIFSGQEGTALIGAIIFGILFAFFFSILPAVGVTMCSAALFAMIVMFLLESLGLSGMWWVILMAALVGAILGSIFSRTFVIFGSALQGGYLMVLSVLILYVTYSGQGVQDVQSDPLIALLVLIIAFALGMIGVALQYRSVRYGDHREIEPVLRRDKKQKIYHHRIDH